MSNSSPDSNFSHEAISGYAAEIHAQLMDDLNVPHGAETEMADRYPLYLFGMLAMKISGVELPPSATGLERTKGIIEGLRRVATNPELFERITGAPYSAELATQLDPQLPAPSSADTTLHSNALKLRSQAREHSYLMQSNIPMGNTVQLEYTAASTIKPNRRSLRPWLRKGETFTMKLTPTNDIVWDITRYNYRNGQRHNTGKRQEAARDLFYVVATNPIDRMPRRLRNLTGGAIDLGAFSVDTQFKVRYNFRCSTSELEGTSTHPWSRVLKLPATLSQAYLGDSRAYPLFDSRP